MNTRAPHVLRLIAVIAGATAVALFLKFQFGGTWLEFAGFVTGVVGVYLMSVPSVWGYPVGIVNVLLYGFLFFEARLYADMTLQGAFFVLQILGWYQWLRGGSQRRELPISRLAPKDWGLIALVWGLGLAVYIPVVTRAGGAAPVLDSTLTVGSLIAQVLLNRKKIENWILWIGLNLAYLPLVLSRGLTSTAVLYGLFLVLAVSGFISWQREEQAHRAA